MSAQPTIQVRYDPPRIHPGEVLVIREAATEAVVVRHPLTEAEATGGSVHLDACLFRDGVTYEMRVEADEPGLRPPWGPAFTPYREPPRP